MNLMELEEVFSSKPRMKILKLIWKLGSLNVSDIARRLKLNYSSTLKHLKLLEEEEILQQRSYGRIHMYRFSESARAKAVQNLIKLWEN